MSLFRAARSTVSDSNSSQFKKSKKSGATMTMKDIKNPKKEPKTLLTIPEVQKILGIKSRKTILKYIAEGKLPAYKIGGTRWRIDYNDVMTFLKKQFIALADEDAQTLPVEEKDPAAEVST
jgi:excisionase family DNA binding protein